MTYRWRQGDRKGAWYPTKREALARALESGIVRRCRETGSLIWNEGAELEAGAGRGGAKPQAVGSARENP